MKTTWEIYKEKSVNNGLNYQPQLVSFAGFQVAINSTKMHIFPPFPLIDVMIQTWELQIVPFRGMGLV